MTTPSSSPETAVFRRPMDYQTYLSIASETQINEWVNGEVISYMPPLYKHQDIIGFLYGLLRHFSYTMKLGAVLPAPFEVKLRPDGPSREPDLLFISNDKTALLTPKKFEGAPDLVVEIVSHSSVTEDRVEKFREYQEAGVREYWIVDPRTRQQQMDVYILTENGTFDPLPFSEEGVFYSAVLPHFWFKADWLWQNPLPNPQLTLAEIMVTVPGLPDEVRQSYQVLRDWLSK